MEFTKSNLDSLRAESQELAKRLEAFMRGDTVKPTEPVVAAQPTVPKAPAADPDELRASALLSANSQQWSEDDRRFIAEGIQKWNNDRNS